MDTVPQAVRAQVQVAAAHYRELLGRDPMGIWLPECGYMPGQERFLREAGLRYSFLESHGLTDADPRPRHGVLAPIVSPGRDRVLRPRHGVVAPGLERGVGLSRATTTTASSTATSAGSCPLDYLGDVLPDGMRKNVGIKYFRVTGKVALAREAALRPGVGAGEGGAATPATSSRTASGRSSTPRRACPQPPLVVSPYDAELFGHWWFEGPMFLDFLFRKMHFDQDVVKPITPPEFLDATPSARSPSRRCAPGARRASPRCG